MARKARITSTLGNQLGKRVAERRKAHGWLQAELADKLGVETETISRFQARGHRLGVTQARGQVLT